jgi:hypothetical protein
MRRRKLDIIYGCRRRMKLTEDVYNSCFDISVVELAGSATTVFMIPRRLSVKFNHLKETGVKLLVRT